jgi:hypothetical protein
MPMNSNEADATPTVEASGEAEAKRTDQEAGEGSGVAVLACAVMDAEVETLVKRLGAARLVFVEQGLHNEPDRLRERLQEHVDELEQDPTVRSIALVYGVCSRGTADVTSRRCRLVIPRAHDCITLLMGDKERYRRYAEDHPGTYWYSPGWNRHHTPPGPERWRKQRERYVAEYGEDNADFLMEHEQHWFASYDRATYVHLSIGATDAELAEDLAYTRSCAEWLGWATDVQAGDPQLLADLIAGRWDDERFLVLEPGERYRLTADSRVIERETSAASTHAPIGEAGR